MPYMTLMTRKLMNDLRDCGYISYSEYIKIKSEFKRWDAVGSVNMCLLLTGFFVTMFLTK